ncbi:MAG TPA: helicase-related protein [Terriglobia bacterium]|nr:helicase-related protein [Terriglobia bacterium]
MELTSAGELAVGSLVRVRERDWVVLPSDDPEILKLRPLSGSEAEACGILKALEGDQVRQAEFPEPNPEGAGDFISGKLLRDAARLSLRSGAGPFRSLGRLSVRPRPYQFVPLIMALRLDPVRLLIADDVGVGKTIEGALIARELLDRGDAHRLCVLCPPHLCDQWKRELEQKFNLQPAVVRTSTIARLERELPRRDLSIYTHYPHLVVSIDFVKSERRQHDFLTHCPDLVIVDEAHAAARPGARGSRDQQQRYSLVEKIAKDDNRHLLLLTATPHSGVEDSFMSLLGLLNRRFERLSLGELSEAERKSLARHFVQRRRPDVERWLGAETFFPTRDPSEQTYALSPEYRRLFDEVLAFTRETVREPGLSQPRQRVRYWAALALLRCLMSSPAAAAKALLARLDGDRTVAEDTAAEEARPREILDPLEEGTMDSVPEAALEAGEVDLADRDRRRLNEFARRAEAMRENGQDVKVSRAADIVRDLLRKGFKPIVYCRFVATADYVAEQLQAGLKAAFTDVHVVSVTGESGNDEEREARVAELAESPRRVLVATDCLSEGINLQDQFDAVVHYDLPWNPNRLEQREGRVDRFGQQTRSVPAVLFFGADNPIDAIVLRVLIRKARDIYRTLGISVPVPVSSESVVQAIVKALFEEQPAEQLRLNLEGFATVDAVHEEWDRAVNREKESRTRFAQHAIKPEEVARELEAVDTVLGDPDAVRGFMIEAAARVPFSFHRKDDHFLLDPATPPAPVRERITWKKPRPVVFDAPPPKDLDDVVVLGRNHPVVAALCDHILGTAFRPGVQARFSRAGAAFTDQVRVRTGVAIIRIRYRLKERRGDELFAEEVVTTGFRRADSGLEWLAADSEEMLELLKTALPVGSISQQERVLQVNWALQMLAEHQRNLTDIADRRASELEESHARLREYTGGGRIKAEAYPPDVLAVYTFVPGGGR